jgi:hypothetical protein
MICPTLSADWRQRGPDSGDALLQPRKVMCADQIADADPPFQAQLIEAKRNPINAQKRHAIRDTE